MAKDFENISGLENMSDGELRALIRSRLDEQVSFDPADVEVEVNRGVVRLSGRVGTESELRVVDHLVTDVIGLSSIENDIYVDMTRRAESPVAMDEHLADEAAHDGLLLGDSPRSESPEAAHLNEDLSAETNGTTDITEAIGEGIPWNPPTSPTPEGLRGTDVPADTGGEEH